MGGISLNVNDLCHFSSPVEEKKKLKFALKLLLFLFLFLLEFIRSCS